MSNASKLSLIREMLDSAESSIRSAKQLITEVSGIPTSPRSKYIEKADSLVSEPTGGRIIEGVFDGQGMIDKEGSTYPVPANYASKSKLIPGDVLKLTITDEGRFVYKQIGPIPRQTVIGPLTNEDGQYKVLANGKAYKVLLASVTYFRANVGDEVTLVIPEKDDSEWGAIEAVLPKFSQDLEADNDEETEPEEDEEKDEE